MKWPTKLIIIRHAESAYNILKAQKAKDQLYRRFKTAFNRDHRSVETRALAERVREKYALGVSNADTDITTDGSIMATNTGRALADFMNGVTPDVILVSPFLRTVKTLGCMTEGWPYLLGVKTVSEDRIREQEHGLSLLYNDWRVFETLHPEQRDLRLLEGPYWYRYPQGESVSDVRNRIRSVTETLVREYSGHVVVLITHHLTKLSIRANLERLSPEEFIRLDNHEKPINCGVTVYEGNPTVGKDGRLELKHYNMRLYAECA